MLLSFIETVRRFFAVVFVLGGIWLFLLPEESLVVVRLVDFQSDLDTSPYFHSKDETLADFIRKRTSGRSVVTEDVRWREFAASLRTGSPAGSLQSLQSSRGQVRWVFEVESLPDLPKGAGVGLLYISIPSERTWINLSPSLSQEIQGLDSRFVYPLRRLGGGLVLAGFLVYFLLPRLKVPEGALTHSRGAAVVGPDVLGLLGGGFFFALPLLILGENAPGQMPWDSTGGWHILTLAFWSMSALFLSMVGIGLYYATLWITVSDDGILMQKGFSAQRYAWSEMVSCKGYRSKRGKVIGFLLILLANSPTMAGQGSLVASNEEQGLEIQLKGGRSVRIMANSFAGFGRVVDALRSRGIKGANTLEL